MSQTILRFDNLNLALGVDKLLDNVNVEIKIGERICLLGRNGSGKSSLLKVIQGLLQPDDGELWLAPSLKIATLAQNLPEATDKTVYDYVTAGLKDLGKLLADYHHLTKLLTTEQSNKVYQSLEIIQQKIDAQNGWNLHQKIESTLSRLSINGENKLCELSGGWLRRVNLAQALVQEPNLLLLDEPTNHLDLETIRWLEEQLLAFNATILFVTHDRAFLRKLATKIIELDRGKILQYSGGYDRYLKDREHFLEIEARERSLFNKKLAKEEEWIRQGIKARRTRNEGRVRALKTLRAEKANQRTQQGHVKFQLTAEEKSSALILWGKDINYCYNETPIVKGFSFQIAKGDKIGLLGPNGCGKTTLVELLLKKLKPQSGNIQHSPRIEVAYFDQLRKNLDWDKSVLENLAEGREYITLNEQPRHVISYLQDFLFTPERANTRVSSLSGGECNRLLLARLFSKSFNFLVMDEPTNDLDIETIELLEDLLVKYKGTLLLISHDREFLDNVITTSWVFEGAGKIQEYIGGYQSHHETSVEKINKAKKENTKNKAPSKNYTYEQQKELTNLPKLILKLEEKQVELEKTIAEPGFYEKEKSETNRFLDDLEKVKNSLETAYSRWDELEKIINS